jgi:hypothetical protein
VQNKQSENRQRSAPPPRLQVAARLGQQQQGAGLQRFGGLAKEERDRGKFVHHRNSRREIERAFPVGKPHRVCVRHNSLIAPIAFQIQS